MKVFFNGKIIPLEKIHINPYDIGFLRGYAVFDVMRIHNNKPFLLKEHYERFQKSAKTLKLKVPFSKNDFIKITENLIRINNLLNKNAIIRTILTGGISFNAFTAGNPNCYILIEKFVPLPRQIYEKGAKIITLKYQRHLPLAKTTNYIEPIRNDKLKKRNNALEIVYINNGVVLEASTSNFFIVKSGKIITPKEKVLKGITRGLIIKLARGKFSVEEREISEKEMRSADEAFLTATNKDIVPVIQIDGNKVNNGKIGENTKILMNKLSEFLKKY
ncbi:MAG: aminotransferase class IV [Patescibacteria group bacterium]